MTTEIPQPPGWPVIGNLLELIQHESTARFAAQYWPIFKVKHGPGKPYKLHICSAELLNEICDEKRFVKNPTDGGLFEVRNGTGDGLFTAFHCEENWGLAHRILMPVLGPLSVGKMFEDMHEVACQLVLKWARLGQTARINVGDDFTRLTLDTLALCTMDTRFNSFYSETPHSFVSAMKSFLLESGSRSSRPSFVTNYVYWKGTRKYYEDIELMRDVANQVIKRRRTNTSDKKDLVDAMIHEKDPKSGKTLPESSIINNMITFLIAGHETTSGLLSFLLYLLVRNPNAMKKAQAEVISVLGDGAMTSSMTSRLPYVSAAIRETLRLHPTAPGFSVQPLSSNPGDYPLFIGQKRYPIHQHDTLHALLPRIHRDSAVFGDDAEDFRPERMLDEHFNKLPRNSWKPFGNGARGCIGRAFALQESIVVVALLLQNYDFELYDPDYQLAVRKTLTVKPKDFFVRARLRDGLSLGTLQRRLLGTEAPTPGRTLGTTHKSKRSGNDLSKHLKDLLICYGSNTGTCQTLAHSLAREACSYGFYSRVMSMDEALHNIIAGTPVVIVTASYEGSAPDNATKFIEWLERLTESPFIGCHHAVFGCGNRDWVDTFQRIPTIVDDALTRCGSIPLVRRGISDTANNNVFNEFDQWADKLLWPTLAKQYSTKAQNLSEQGRTKLDVAQSSQITGLLQDGYPAVVQEEATLTAADEPEKRHIKAQLPKEVTYTVGDYLAVVPVNHDTVIMKILTRFGLAIDSKVVDEDGSETSTYTFLRENVEVNQVATAKNIHTIMQGIPDLSTSLSLESTSSSTTIASQRLSVFDLLLQFPTASLSFSEYLSMLPPLRPRQYSISSSPAAIGSNICTLTYSVLKEQGHTTHTSPDPDGDPTACATPGKKSSFPGVASNYLASLRPNDRMWVAVRPGHPAFRPTENDLTTRPIVLVCAGSGIAPFMGFVQERARLLSKGGEGQSKISGSVASQSAANMVLFIGCRHPERDALYADQLAEWAGRGVLQLNYAFSQASERSEGCKYVQEKVWMERKRAESGVIDLLVKGERKGKMYVCGNRKVVEGVGKVVVEACMDFRKWGVEEAERWFRKVKSEGRFVAEAFD